MPVFISSPGLGHAVCLGMVHSKNHLGGQLASSGDYRRRVRAHEGETVICTPALPRALLSNTDATDAYDSRVWGLLAQY